MKQKWALSLLGVAMCMSIATSAFAQSAPVFDVDSMLQDDDLPMPPPPGQEGMENALPVTSSVSMGSTDQRIRRLEQQIANLQENSASQRIEVLQKEVQSLRNQVEQLTHQLQQAEAQQKTMYADLDKRLTQSSKFAITNDTPQLGGEVEKPSSQPVAAKTASVAATTTQKAANSIPSTTASDQQPNVAEEQQIYQTAYNHIKAKKYNEAINALQGMLQKYPSGQFASNAHYWLGELYGLVGKNDQALKEFNIVVKTYSNSPRVSDAQLKIGLLHAAQSQWSEAKAAFKKVINRYPGTTSAKLASTQLKQIKEAGH